MVKLVLFVTRISQNLRERDASMADMRQLDTERTSFLDSLKKANPLFSRIVALNTYLSYFNNNNGRYTDELRASQAVREFVRGIEGVDTVTLLYASKNAAENHALILQEYLQRAAGGATTA